MRRLILIGTAVCLALSACNGGVNLGEAPAPLAQTKIDDTALIAADRGFDAFLDAVNLLRSQRIIVDGSPKAIAMAKAIRTVDSALNVAARAAAAGHATTYKDALEQAQAGIAELRRLLRS